MEEEKKDLAEQKEGREDGPKQKRTFMEGLNAWAESVPSRSCTLMGLVGAYLIYTGYSLISGVVKGDEGASWIFALIGVLFILIAALFLFVAFKGYSRRNKEKQQEAEKQQEQLTEESAAEEEKEISEAAEKTPAEEVKKSSGMSLAERASLAGRPEDGEETPEEEEDHS